MYVRYILQQLLTTDLNDDTVSENEGEEPEEDAYDQVKYSA